MLRNGIIAYPCELVQNWYDNGPDPCEQSTFPFQKSDRYDNGMISFPCERRLNLNNVFRFQVHLALHAKK